MSGLLETDIDGRLMSVAFRFPRRGASRARPLECSVYEGREIRRYAPQLSSGGSSPGPGSRMSVSSNSVTAGAGCSTTSTVVVSTTGAIGGFAGLAFFRPSFFALERLTFQDCQSARRPMDVARLHSTSIAGQRARAWSALTGAVVRRLRVLHLTRASGPLYFASQPRR